MNPITYERKAPESSIIKDQDFRDTNYEDAISVEIPLREDYSIDSLTSAFLSITPAWVSVLLKIRNMLVKPFGLQTGTVSEFEGMSPDRIYQAGEQAMIFKVIKRSDKEIVMGGDDKHLNFRTSIMTGPAKNAGSIKLSSITIVKFNKLMGKLYFLPVKPFHKLIIKATLKVLYKNLTKNPSK